MRTSNRVPRPAGPPGRADARRPGRPRPRTGQARPHEWFARQLLLVLSGQRPVHALLGHAGPEAYDALARLAPRTPLRPPPGERWAPVLRGVGACRPDTDVIEAFARIDAGGRTRALAFRLERAGSGRWKCCAIEADVDTVS